MYTFNVSISFALRIESGKTVTSAKVRMYSVT